MFRRQPRSIIWPRRWLMTDERIGDALWTALGRLPRGSGVIFRHDGLPEPRRERLGRAVARTCRRRALVLGVSRDVGLARRLGAALVHNPEGPAGLMPLSCSVHDEAEAGRARASGAALVFVSPVFPTRSHPTHAGLGIDRAADLASRSAAIAIALGGMDETRFHALRGRGFDGYAGIDCWIRT